MTPMIDVLAGAFDHLHGDRAGDAEGAGHADSAAAEEQGPARPNDRTIVVQVLANGKGEPSYKINEDDFAKAALEPKLAEIFATRQEKVMFVKGDAGSGLQQDCRSHRHGPRGRSRQHRPDYPAHRSGPVNRSLANQ